MRKIMVRKLALLVGCDYSSNSVVPEDNKLYGCINDVNAMQALIRERFGFEDKNITILTEETEETEKKPKYSTIIAALINMIDEANLGDTLLLYFSGGGALAQPTVTNEFTKGTPSIIPCDLFPIPATKIVPIIKRLPPRTFFTFICDSSYSSGLFDENFQTEFNVRDYGPNFRRKTIPSNLLQSINVFAKLPADITLKNKILISSSEVNEESVEVYPNGDKSKAFSAFSNAIQTLLNSPQAGNDPEAGNTNREVEAFTTALLGFLRFRQRPYLNCSGNDAAAPFLGGTVA